MRLHFVTSIFILLFARAFSATNEDKCKVYENTKECKYEVACNPFFKLFYGIHISHPFNVRSLFSKLNAAQKETLLSFAYEKSRPVPKDQVSKISEDIIYNQDDYIRNYNKLSEYESGKAYFFKETLLPTESGTFVEGIFFHYENYYLTLPFLSYIADRVVAGRVFQKYAKTMTLLTRDQFMSKDCPKFCGAWKIDLWNEQWHRFDTMVIFFCRNASDSTSSYYLSGLADAPYTFKEKIISPLVANNPEMKDKLWTVLTDFMELPWKQGSTNDGCMEGLLKVDLSAFYPRTWLLQDSLRAFRALIQPRYSAFPEEFYLSYDKLLSKVPKEYELFFSQKYYIQDIRRYIANFFILFPELGPFRRRLQ